VSRSGFDRDRQIVRVLDARHRADRVFAVGERASLSGFCTDMLVREMLGAERHRDRERRSFSNLAFGLDRAAVQLDEFLHKSESDASAFDTSPACAFDPVEALEQTRQFVGGNANARVGDAHENSTPVAARLDRDPDLAVVRELERVREQIDQDLLPHFAIEIDRRGEPLGFDGKAQARLFDRGAEDGGDLRAKGGDVGRLERSLHAAGFDAREIQKAVHQPQKAHVVPVHHRELLVRFIVLVLPREHVLERTEHQRQWRAELMTDI
jgi:hypothetical protein